jgi:hypothetical protein
VAIAILAVIVGSLQQSLASALSAYSYTKSRRDLLSQANYAIRRMAMFVQEARAINVPAGHQLEVPECVIDTYDNTTHAYRADGDGFLDTDRDSDGFVDEGDGDSPGWVKFEWIGAENRVIERFPDYSTADEGDYKADRVICEKVTFLKFTKMQNNLLQIELTLADGNNQISLKTRAKARYIP